MSDSRATADERAGRELSPEGWDSTRGQRPLTRSAWRRRYILRRLLTLFPLAFLATVAAFGLTKLAPGGAMVSLLNENQPASQEVRDAISRRYHLNDPLVVQYWHWLGGVIHGDLGRSIMTNDSVLNEIHDRIGATLMLNIGANAFAIFFGILFGVLAALNRTRWPDRALVGFSVMGMSTPPFALGIVLIFLLGFKLGWFPLYGAGSGFGGHVHHFALPILVLGVHGMGLMMRITRAAMLNQLDQDYVPFARARGVSESRIVVRYALRNTLIPVSTAAGLLFLGLLTGSVLVETVFGLAGLGTLLVSSVTNGDIPVIQGLVLMIAAWIIVVNLMVDMMYVAIDPRVGFEEARE